MKQLGARARSMRYITIASIKLAVFLELTLLPSLEKTILTREKLIKIERSFVWMVSGVSGSIFLEVRAVKSSWIEFWKRPDFVTLWLRYSYFSASSICVSDHSRLCVCDDQAWLCSARCTSYLGLSSTIRLSVKTTRFCDWERFILGPVHASFVCLCQLHFCVCVRLICVFFINMSYFCVCLRCARLIQVSV